MKKELSSPKHFLYFTTQNSKFFLGKDFLCFFSRKKTLSEKVSYISGNRTS